MDIQVLIPPALAALHNFIQDYDPEEIHMYNDQAFDFRPDPEFVGELGIGPATLDERNQANER